MNPWWQARVRPELLTLVGYSSARMEAKGGNVWLNANESPWPSAADPAGDLQRYTEPQPVELKRRMAEYLGVPAANVLLGRGSDEAIDLLTRAFCRAGVDEVLVCPPTFGMYAVAAAIQGAAVVEAPLDPARGYALVLAEVLAAVGPMTKIVWLCTPNNPTGTTLPRTFVLALAQALAECALVVVDEAYVEYAGEVSMVREAAQPGNLAVLRTLSKAHAMAAARVGCVVADAGLIELLRRLMAPYPLTTPSAQAASAALTPEVLAVTHARTALIVAERGRIADALATLAGVQTVIPSAANFLTVRFADAARIRQTLAGEGIIVRDVSHQRGLDNCLRLTIGTAAQNDRVLAVLRGAARAAA